jgi:Na+-driven multidrug efflux pump
LGLPAYALVKVVVTAFYARKDTKTPVKVATLCLIINMVGNVLLMGRWGVGGLAFATAFASFVNGGCFAVALRKNMGLLGGRKIFGPSWEAGRVGPHGRGGVGDASLGFWSAGGSGGGRGGGGTALYLFC